MFRGHKTEVGHELGGSGEAADIVDFAQERESCEGFDSSETAEGFDVGSVRRRFGSEFKFSIEGPELRVEVLKMFELDGQGGV